MLNMEVPKYIGGVKVSETQHESMCKLTNERLLKIRYIVYLGNLYLTFEKHIKPVAFSKEGSGYNIETERVFNNK